MAATGGCFPGVGVAILMRKRAGAVWRTEVAGQCLWGLGDRVLSMGVRV